ncbi:MAG: glycosyl hydrolase [Myxococcaceae bacterium]|nr:glycosyl hydrolase [Myxococcaceae bacterium]
MIRTVCWLFALAFVTSSCNCDPQAYSHLYKTSDRAPNMEPEDIENLRYLGPTFVDVDGVKGVNFGLYSENAERVEILLFDDPESNRPTRQFEMKRFGDVWNLFIEGVGIGQHYGFIAWGPNWHYDPNWLPGKIDGFVADVDAAGNRFNPNKLLMDPYAKAVHRDHDWSKGSTASGPKRTEVTWGASAKSVVVASHYQWGEAEAAWQKRRRNGTLAGHGPNELVIYEVHPKGFTMSPASGVEHPGTFRGIGEMADYLKDLGINAVELMPIHEKPLDGGYWGYQTLNWFQPELSYAFARRPGEPIDEFKWMVEELHKRDIEVILDVVYNHTGEGGLWRNKIEQDVSPDPSVDSQLVNFDPKEVAGLYSYRGIDNQAYYALQSDRGLYVNNTGVGNETRCNHRPMRKLILDSLHYFVEEMHVDGFRFDLAPVLGEKDGSWQWAGDDAPNTVLEDIIEDPVLRANNIRVIAEPWSLQAYAIGGFPVSSDGQVGWYEWNGRFRDWWREFINCDTWTLNSSSRHGCGDDRDKGVEDGGALLTGSQWLYGRNGRRPYHSVNFITVHDGFTLYDLFTYAMKRNKCGPLNPVCCDQPNSPFCDRDSGESNNRSRDWGDEALKRQMMRNAFVALMIAHGTPLILGGDEWMRTQLGNNNAYSNGADNEFNWFDWGSWKPNDEKNRMHDFVRQLVHFRRDNAWAFAPTDYAEGAASFEWRSPMNTPADANTWNGRSIMLHYAHPPAGKAQLVILINMAGTQVDFTLPPGSWARVLDTQSYFDRDDGFFASPDFPGEKPVRRSWNITTDAPSPVPGNNYGVPPRSIVILQSFQP